MEQSLENFIVQQITQQMQLKTSQVKGTVKLLEEGNTIPFITRYRKELTGGLDEEKIQTIQDNLEYLKNLETRKQEVIEKISEQGKLTPELQQQIQKASQLKIVEDLYLPYKAKRRTRATIAREQGLEPLAQMIIENRDIDMEQQAQKFVDPEKKVDDTQTAIKGAMDIVAEVISENAEIREILRKITSREASVNASKANTAEDNNAVYKDYYDYLEPLSKIPPHRILALDRGEEDKVLRVKLDISEDAVLPAMEKKYILRETKTTETLKAAIRDSYKRLIAPAISREIRNELTERAHEHAIHVFSQNLKNLLLQPPLQDMRIMAIDPGYVSGCKLATIDETGRLLHYDVIYPHEPQKKMPAAKKKVLELIQKDSIQAVAIGNGTACRETEMFVSDLITEEKLNIVYTIVNEAGASVYSASSAAREEFPELDASYRGTISIGRRLLDPLAELVKIDPKSLGVGLYQHDLNAKQLEKALHRIVESCVNFVGVDVNRASAELLSYVAGINKRSAKNIVKHREKKGRYQNREDLKSVSGIGEETFTQCSGFLRVVNGDNPLDNTSIHPESYSACRQLFEMMGNDVNNIESPSLKLRLGQLEIASTATRLSIGSPTLQDIVENLLRPGRDPREELPPPIFRKGVITLDDLESGMILNGTVRNVVDFGAFVDIGVKMDGLVHVSRMAKKFVKDPLDICKVGDNIEVKILDIDRNRGRISLSMVLDE